MKRYITIDGGTTTTRLSLVEDMRVTDTLRISRGARSGIDDRQGLKIAIKDGIRALLDRNSLDFADIYRILASGMITSEFGLIELPHVKAPAGIETLHNTMEEVRFDEIAPIPFYFVRGIRIVSDRLSEIDIMRGEESELYGLCDEIYEDAVYVLPGSHSKIIKTDRYGRIDRFATMLTGEMIASVSQNTILKDAVDLTVGGQDTEMLIYGYKYAKAMGINNALFKVRILKNIQKRPPVEVYSFFLGIMLSDEIDYILSLDAKSIIIGGKQQIKLATASLLSALCDKTVTVIPDERVDISNSLGMIKIFEA